MDPISRERLIGVTHALDAPGTRWLIGLILAMLVIVPAVFLLLGVVGKLAGPFRAELWKRYWAAAVIVSVVVGVLLLGAAWAVALITGMSLFCYAEFARATGLFRQKLMSALVCLGIVLAGLACLDNYYRFFVAIAPMGLVVISIVAITADQPKGFIQRIGLACFSLLLFGACLGHLAFLTTDAHYRALILLLMVTVSANDTFALFVGKAIGGPKLCPNTSPNKTISGSAGGLVIGTALFIVLGRIVFQNTSLAGWGHLLAMGLIVSLTGQCGDLTISSMKRDIGIKDMGSIIPGHGGILDRCNSLLLSSPALFHYINYHIGVGVDQPVRIFSGG